ncbi:MAG: phosphodiester glycosidase family protein [Oscillospiraceae bacterium]|nr:phosphodiester glycosidase family protein [Oscillospiraceae bacterium]
MEHEEFNFDDIMAELQAQLYEDTASRSEPLAEKPQQPRQAPRQVSEPVVQKPSRARRVGRFFARWFIFLALTVLLLAVTLYGAMYVVCKGPSESARDMFVMSVRETSAVGFLAELFFTEEEIAAIENKSDVEEYIETDTSLINIAKPEEKAEEDQEAEQQQGPVADEWGFVDEDGDGIIIDEVKGEGYSGYMMIIQDPSRVIMGSVPKAYGGRGYTVEAMVAEFDAVAGINAGGFEDPDGKGNGSIPNSMVVYDGKVYYEGKGTANGFVGIDSNNILHVAKTISSADVAAKDIRYGVSFGPVLVSNGEACDVGSSGVNPRTAIGQRSDGAILMLVIDGRQVISLGATYQDLVDIFLEYGAVNACNLDGGSSSLMWFEDDYVNNCASVIGIRPVPTTFLVLKEGVEGNE